MATLDNGTLYSGEKLQEFAHKASTLKNDIHACVGNEIENLGLAARMYVLYIQQDMLSDARARKGGEQKLITARLYTNQTLALYYQSLKAKQISNPVSYMERAYSGMRLAKFAENQAA